jgi:hypothetical protein
MINYVKTLLCIYLLRNKQILIVYIINLINILIYSGKFKL